MGGCADRRILRQHLSPACTRAECSHPRKAICRDIITGSPFILPGVARERILQQRDALLLTLYLRTRRAPAAGVFVQGRALALDFKKRAPNVRLAPPRSDTLTFDCATTVQLRPSHAQVYSGALWKTIRTSRPRL